MRAYLLLITCLLTWEDSFVQNFGNITGKIVDGNGKNLSNVQVKLFYMADTTTLKVVQTNTDGKFVFDQIVLGDYELAVNQMGYKSMNIPANMLKDQVANLSIKLEALTVHQKRKALEPKIPYVKREIDSIVCCMNGSMVSIARQLNSWTRYMYLQSLEVTAFLCKLMP